ncbi:hypothetical protein [Chamaesiphon sp. GL140_3_metabinner_50]|uniref:hypothetical protein n=1 Tax=Chamaesiphon sp. GL140_3_metabinner_50 TaxID=2970812 RepID=UPI0025CBFABD|nr:hypothetical protein [Chamaesiphon sp. GL140_3_metabinner_50]
MLSQEVVPDWMSGSPKSFVRCELGVILTAEAQRCSLVGFPDGLEHQDRERRGKIKNSHAI